MYIIMRKGDMASNNYMPMPYLFHQDVSLHQQNYIQKYD